MQKQTSTQKEGTIPNTPEGTAGKLIGALQRLTDRLIEGFWEAVCRSLFSGSEPLGERFLCVMLFLSFSGLAAIASLAPFPLTVYGVPFALAGFVGGFSFSFSKKRVSSFGFSASILFGIALACVFLPHGALLAVTLALQLGFRLLLGGGALREALVLRALFSAAFSALYALVEWVFFSAEGGVLRVLSCALFTLLLCAAFCGLYLYTQERTQLLRGEKGAFTLSLLGRERRLCLALSGLSFFGCVLYALRSSSLFGFSPSLIAAACLTLLAARRAGGETGAFCGIVLGFAAGGEAGALALFCAGLFFGIGLTHSRTAAFCLSFLASAGFLLAFSSALSFSYLAADLALAHVLFYPVFSVLRRRAEKDEDDPAPRRSALAALSERLSHLSEAFGELSEVFYMATDRSLTPSGQLAARLIREASERVCVRCSKSSDCWQQNYGLTQGALTHLSAVLAKKREVHPEDLEPYFKSRCKKAEALCREINRRYAHACASEEAPEVPASLLCGEYGSVSRLLSTTAQEVRREEKINEEKSRLAMETLTRLGIPYRSAAVSGGRVATLTVTGVPLSKLSLSTDRLVGALEEAMGMRFESPRFLPPLSDATMILDRRRAVKLSCARVVRARASQTVSGDSTGFFESDVGFFYSIICDGMGSGRQAAFTSRLATIFIEKLLTFSREKGVTLEMLNRFLLSQKEERFSTVDLLEIDFYTGQANFIKAGAVSSYIKRGTGLYRISSKTPPAGILGEISAEQTTLNLQGGDRVVMFSDGVVPEEESDAWFAETLAFAPNEDAQKLAKYLITKAREHHGEAADDMSIAVLEVHAA